jgi:hypothetical protein
VANETTLERDAGFMRELGAAVGAHARVATSFPMKRRGHFCWMCGRVRPNEKFSGSGHRDHVCKECAARQRRERRAGAVALGGGETTSDPDAAAQKARSDGNRDDADGPDPHLYWYA